MIKESLMKTKDIQIIRLSDRPELKDRMAQWFHEKWGIPLEAYQESMTATVRLRMIVPQWYVAMAGDTIVGGLGVIENDFHERKDLTPNVCAVYVEKPYRGRKIAGKLLNFVCEDMKAARIQTLYLVTDHTGFYEKYGWEFLCMVKEEGSDEEGRMYIHK